MDGDSQLKNNQLNLSSHESIKYFIKSAILSNLTDQQFLKESQVIIDLIGCKKEIKNDLKIKKCLIDYIKDVIKSSLNDYNSK